MINFDELSKIKIGFVDLGEAVAELSVNNTAYFEELQANNAKVKASVNALLDQESLKAAIKSADKMAKQVDAFSASVSDISSHFAGLEGIESNLDAAANKFSKFADQLESLAKSPSSKARVRSATRVGGGPPKKKDGALKKVWNSKEVKGTRGSLSKITSPLMLPKWGSVASTTILWAAFGFMETQRLKALAGKAKNVLVSAVDGALETATSKATTWLGAFAERMNKFYGISEQEVLGLEQKFVDLGFTVEETINQKIGPSIDGLHGNVVSLSLSLDKVFEQATGTHAEKMGDYAKRYGMSLEESANTLSKMYALGSGEGGIGSLNFLKHIEKSMDALENMGYKLTEVVDVFEVMRKRFEDVGVPKHLAAITVSTGLQEIASGMGGAGLDWEVMMSEMLGFGRSLEGRNEFVDSMTRMTESTPERWTEEILKITKALDIKVGGDRAMLRVLLEEGAGWGKKGSMLATKLLEASEGGSDLKIKDAEKKLAAWQTEHKNALKTESEKLSEMKKLMEEWKVGQREVGQGLFGLAIDTISVLFAFFKSIPTLVGTYLQIDQEKGRQERELLFNKIASFGNNMPAHLALAMRGGEKLMGAGGGMIKEAIGSSMQMLMQANSFNPAGKMGFELPAISKPWSLSSSGYQGPPTVKIVTIPIAMSQNQQDLEMNNMNSEMVQQSIDENWVGGNLRLQSHGVTELGDLQFSLAGNCPRCGLVYTTEDQFGPRTNLGTPSLNSLFDFSTVDSGDENFKGKATSDRQGVKDRMLTAANDPEQLNALTRMLISEAGATAHKSEAGRTEMAGIGYTAFNRLGNKKNQGKDLVDVIYGPTRTAGKQGQDKRQYGTARGDNPDSNNYKQTQQFAKRLLSGDVDNPVGASTSFVHTTGGIGYNLSKKKMQENREASRLGLPDPHAGNALAGFQREGRMVNTTNLPTDSKAKARFYASAGSGADPATSKEAMDTKQIKKWESRHDRDWEG